MKDLINYFQAGYLDSLLQVFLRYIIPLTILFGLFYFKENLPWNEYKIQKEKEVEPKLIKHDLVWFSSSMLILSIILTFWGFAIFGGYTQVYFSSDKLGLWYLPFSFVTLLFLHDTYFYWVHRSIHGRKLYKLIHRTHHRSSAPTPINSFSVTAYEGLAELLFLPIMTFILPLNFSLVFVYATFYFIYNMYLHLGYEILPKSWVNLPFLKYINTAVHHDLHHSKLRYNFGLFFNIWDRWMGTMIPEYELEYEAVYNNSSLSQ